MNYKLSGFKTLIIAGILLVSFYCVIRLNYNNYIAALHDYDELMESYNNLTDSYSALINEYDVLYEEYGQLSEQYQLEKQCVEYMSNELDVVTHELYELRNRIPYPTPEIMYEAIIEIDGLTDNQRALVEHARKYMFLTFWEVSVPGIFYTNSPKFTFKYSLNHGGDLIGTVQYDKTLQRWKIIEWEIV